MFEVDCEILNINNSTEIEDVQIVKKQLAEEKEKNASLEKELAQSNKANEDLCAGLRSAKKKDAEMKTMLSAMVKVSDEKNEIPECPQYTSRRCQITETCDDTFVKQFQNALGPRRLNPGTFCTFITKKVLSGTKSMYLSDFLTRSL